MKKILCIFFAVFMAFMPTTIYPAANHNKSNAYATQPYISSEKHLFNEAVKIIKKYETLNKAKDWPYIGYGHKVMKDEPYKRGVELSAAQAEKLLRSDLKKLCSKYSDYGKDAILLGALAYNCGPRVVERSSLLKHLRAGNRDIHKIYTSFCRYKGKAHRGIKQRREVEFKALFRK